VRYLGSWPTGVVVGAPPPQLDEATRWLAGLRDGATGEGQVR
jgi:prephenate dehydratase